MFLVNKRQFAASSGKKCYLFLSIENRRIFCVLENVFQMYGTTVDENKQQSCLVDWGDHVGLQFQQPLFHLTTSPGRGDNVMQLDHLTLTALHMCDFKQVSKLQRCNSLETFLQVWLHPDRTAQQYSFSSLFSRKTRKKLSPQGKSFWIFSLIFVNCYQNQ